MSGFQTNRAALVGAIILLVVSGVVSNKFLDFRKSSNHYNYVKEDAKGAIAFGFESLRADIMWIDLVQEMGKVKGKVTDEQAKYFFESFEKIAQLDPGFDKAIEFGGLRLSVVAPENAMKILERGAERLNKDKKDPWKIPFYGAVIASRYLSDKIVGYEKAIALSSQAMEYGAPEFVTRFHHLSTVRLHVEKGELSKALTYRSKLIEDKETASESKHIYQEQLKELAKQIAAGEPATVKAATDDEKAKAAAMAKKILGGTT